MDTGMFIVTEEAIPIADCRFELGDFGKRQMN
jgi:hypothetical protein